MSTPTVHSPKHMNRYNCHSLLRQCQTLKQLNQLHAQAITQGLHSTPQTLSCAILNSYARFGDASSSGRVFRQIPNPDIVSITSIITLHLQYNEPHKALSLFTEAVALGRLLDGFAVVGALSALGKIRHLRSGKSVHAMVYRRGLGGETVVGNALVDMYCRNGRIKLAQMVFDEMCVRDAVSWSCMLHGYLVCGGFESAWNFFVEMPKRETVAWTVMITGCVQGRRPVWALELFRWMNVEGAQPNLITIVGVLSACADIGALNLGQAIHGYINKMNVSSDVTLQNALINMYSKSGSLGIGCEVFDRIVHKDVYTWTTMISGFAVHGYGMQALEVFSDMLDSCVQPNEVTFIAVLSACSHAGLIDEGRKWFERMNRLCGFKPKLEHYGCMVDILSRAGLLQEAQLLIGEMDVEPDCVIWRSILSASLVHGNVDLAEIAGKEIIKLEPDDDGVYVLLWNMYASSNRWEEAKEIRVKMRSRQVSKKPGYSWIEVDGFVHEFLVEDNMHSLREDIDVVLEGVAMHLKMDSSTFDSED